MNPIKVNLSKIFNRKTFILFWALTFSGVILSQNSNIEVGYTHYLNLGKPTQSEWVLIFDTSKSLFVESSKPIFLDPKDSQIDNSDFLNKKVFITSSPDIDRYVLTDFTSDTLWHQTYILSKPYIVYESLHKPKWNVLDEYKKIDTHLVQKATTSFRGRNYIAWFSLDFPVSFGPWKLKGLPGLILEAYDELNQIHFIVNKVKSSSENLMDTYFNKRTEIGEKIALKDFVELENNEGNEIQKQVLSKMSRLGLENRNLTVSGFESVGRKYRLEMVYEWEN